MEQNVARRRTCDRRIWAKPLARRTRWGYGVCLGVSTLVRVDDRWIAGVDKQDRSVEGVGESISWGSGVQESAGLGLVRVSRDTTSIRAEARRVGIAMNRKLGRINSWPREGKLGDRPWAQFFHEEHGGGTLWTTEANWLGEKGSADC